MNNLQLIVDPVKIPENITFNYAELSTAIKTKMEEYKGLVYTDDQIKEAKTDRADLNRLKGILKDERIRMKKAYLEPFSDFEDKINSLISVIDEPVALIDSQIKEYEKKQKDDKEQEIREKFKGMGFPDYVSLIKVWNPKWLNKSYSMKNIEDDLLSRKAEIQKDIDTIRAIPEFSFEALEAYKVNLSLSEAVAKGKEMADIQQRKQEAEEKARKQDIEGQVAAEQGQIPGEEVNPFGDGMLDPGQIENYPEQEEKNQDPEPVQQEKKETRKKVVIEIVAKESQFEAINDFYRNLKHAAESIRIISKEDL